MEGTAGVWCDGTLLRFRLPDAGRGLAGVTVHTSVFRDRLVFRPVSGSWELDHRRPPVNRLDYHLELLHTDGRRESERGELRCHDYREPDWLALPRAPGRWRRLAMPGGHESVRIWSPETATDRILMAHDGPEYGRDGGLHAFTAAAIADGRIPPYHLVLMPPENRDAAYSASPAHARFLAREALPRIRARLGGKRVVGAGVSLGALAMLHAQRSFPEMFAGVFLQSGSYFQPRYDRQESAFRHWPRIVRFVHRVRRSRTGPAIPATLTCGAAEDNLPNNRDMADALRKQGYPVTFAENPDAHTWTGWRDALHPHLTDLLRRVWPD